LWTHIDLLQNPTAMTGILIEELHVFVGASRAECLWENKISLSKFVGKNEEEFTINEPAFFHPSFLPVLHFLR
jgi:hypothetical protein